MNTISYFNYAFLENQLEMSVVKNKCPAVNEQTLPNN